MQPGQLTTSAPEATDVAQPRSSSGRAASRFTGRWLTLARASWWLLAALSLAFFLSGLREHVTKLSLLWFTTPPTPPTVVHDGLDQLGLSSTLYTGHGLGLYVARAAVFCLVGTLLFWRNSHERMGVAGGGFAGHLTDW